MTIGERIRLRRVELGMTQQELAEKIGYKGKTAVSKIEAGERDLRQSKIKLVADALETTTEYIMGWEGSEPQFDELEKKIIEAYRNKVTEVRKGLFYSTELFEEASEYARFGDWWKDASCNMMSWDGVLKNYCGIKLNICPVYKYNEVIKSGILNEMSCYPSENSICIDNDICIIKVSDEY